MTEPGGPAWRQTTFFPFARPSQYARGEVLESARSPTYETKKYGEAPLVDAVATHDRRPVTALPRQPQPDRAAAARSRPEPPRLTAVVEHSALADADPDATNTLDDQERVTPHPNDAVRVEGGELTITLPPVSWTALSLG